MVYHWVDWWEHHWAASLGGTKVDQRAGPKADWRVVLWAAPWAACSADSTVALMVASRAELRADRTVALWADR